MMEGEDLQKHQEEKRYIKKQSKVLGFKKGGYKQSKDVDWNNRQ